MTNKICENCGKEFPKPYSCSRKSWKKSRFCSQKCRKIRKEISCLICGKVFMQTHIGQRFCSSKCVGQTRVGKPNYSNPDKGHRLTYNCEECGNKKTTKLATYTRSKNHFCSNKCGGLYFGKHHSGEKHPNWKGGISDFQKELRRQPAYEEWRNAVYKRDYWTCQDCHKKVKDIVAHHVFSFKDFPNLRYEVDNGITLCRACHKKRHEEIGEKTRFKAVTHKVSFA